MPRISSISKALRNPVQFARWLSPEDYASPNLKPLPDNLSTFFPHIRRTRPVHNFNVPHFGRIDSRFPGIATLTWDEATIIYNYGMALAGERFLEIGCWVGWSTVVLALAGVDLTVVDPILDGQVPGESCRESLRLAGCHGVKLNGGFSPAAVELLARDGAAWSGFFIDGNHDGDGPLVDVQACHNHAAADSIILLHDAILSDVARAVGWLRKNGWNTGLHLTTRIVAVAWRGKRTPIRHTPDPRAEWGEMRKKLPADIADVPEL